MLSGSTLNILFNLFRVVGPPVWIPIKWNIGFLALNAVMVVLLMRERGEAEELGTDPEQVSFGIDSSAMAPHTPVASSRGCAVEDMYTAAKQRL